jgi:GR25 family glycosyltransferase involved in LPS biosynthesis
MLIDIKEVFSIVINLDEAQGRLKSATQCLNNLQVNFTRYQGIKHSQGIIGCGLSHCSLLENISTNTLVFEDDIAPTSWAATCLAVPDNTDALYLGISDHGYIRGHPLGVKGTVLASQYTSTTKRVYNMCSAHAVLYLSNAYLDTAYETTRYCLEKGIAWDLGIAKLHKDFLVLTPNKPWFYQVGQAAATNFILEV